MASDPTQALPGRPRPKRRENRAKPGNVEEKKTQHENDTQQKKTVRHERRRIEVEHKGRPSGSRG